MPIVPDPTNVIYGIFDMGEPERIRYVGLTTKTAPYRLRGHWKSARNSNLNWPILFWLRKHEVADVGVRVLEVADDFKHLVLLERFWIAQMRELGMADLNLADGGQGAPGVKHTAEYKAKVRERLRRDGNPMQGVKHTPETRAVMSRLLKIRTADPVWRAEQGRKVKAAYAAPGKVLAQALSQSKLTVKDILAIRRLRDVDGLHYQEIVDALPGLPINAHLVGTICRREKWSAVPAEQPQRHDYAHPLPPLSDDVRAKMSLARRGSHNSRAVLTEADVIEIKRSLWNGRPVTAIARERGVPKGMISHINGDHSWTHVPWPMGPKAMPSLRKLAPECSVDVKNPAANVA